MREDMGHVSTKKCSYDLGSSAVILKNAEGLHDTLGGSLGYIPLPSLDTRQVPNVDAAPVGQLFERQTLAFPVSLKELADAVLLTWTLGWQAGALQIPSWLGIAAPAPFGLFLVSEGLVVSVSPTDSMDRIMSLMT
jgi:hypothetical protein